MRQRFAWSPEFLGARAVKYYPLLWAIDPVRVCPVSKKPLASLCFKCRQPLGVLSGGSRIGRCNRCGSDLSARKISEASADPLVGEIRSLDYEVWVAEQVSEYIAFQAKNSLPVDFNFTDVLKFWLQKFELRKSPSTAASIGVSNIAFDRWITRGILPKLRVTLNLCWVFGVTLVEFLEQRVPQNHDGKLRKSIEDRVRHAATSGRRRIDKPGLERELVSILRENRYAMMSFVEICEKKLKRGNFVVRQNFPDLSREISKRYLENRKLFAVLRHDQFCTAIKTVSRFLHSRGIVPNHKTLSPYLDCASKLRCAWAIAALSEVRIELGYEDAGEQLMLLV